MLGFIELYVRVLALLIFTLYWFHDISEKCFQNFIIIIIFIADLHFGMLNRDSSILFEKLYKIFKVEKCELKIIFLSPKINLINLKSNINICKSWNFYFAFILLITDTVHKVICLRKIELYTSRD